MMLRIIVCCLLLGTAGLAIGHQATDRSALKLVGNGLLDDSTVEQLEKNPGKMQCYRSFVHNSLLKKLKCRTTQEPGILAEKE